MTKRNWGKLLRTVEEDILMAQSMTEAVAAGTIVPSMFNPSITIEDIPGGKTIRVKRDHPFSSDDLTDWAQNVRMALLSMWILMVDQGLEDRHGKYRLEDTDEERRAARSVIYQMRCAVAHSSYAPSWKVRAGYKRSFTISRLPSGRLTLDFCKLNGQPFKPSQFGGWYRVIDLLKYVQQFL